MVGGWEVKVVKGEGEWVEIEIRGWRERGGGEGVVRELGGKGMFVGWIGGDVEEEVKRVEKRRVGERNREWRKLEGSGWMKKGEMVKDMKGMWGYGDWL